MQGMVCVVRCPALAVSQLTAGRSCGLLVVLCMWAGGARRQADRGPTECVCAYGMTHTWMPIWCLLVTHSGGVHLHCKHAWLHCDCRVGIWLDSQFTDGGGGVQLLGWALVCGAQTFDQSRGNNKRGSPRLLTLEGWDALSRLVPHLCGPLLCDV